MTRLQQATTQKTKKLNKTIICFAYDSDLYQIYDFYCSRYENISYNEFLDLGINELEIKLMSIPEDEPLYTIIKSRTINTETIKNKDEKKYWNELKRKHKIPSIFISNKELNDELKSKLKSEGMKYVK